MPAAVENVHAAPAVGRGLLSGLFAPPRFPLLPSLIMLTGWAGFAAYVAVAGETDGWDGLMAHFLSPDEEGIRYRALMFFAPMISTAVGYLVNEREKLLRRTAGMAEALGESLDGLRESNRELSAEARRRTDAEERLRAALGEKDVLLDEVNHRAKNNMQLISSVLTLELSRHGERDAGSALRAVNERVRAMALVHEMLVKAGRLTEVDFSAYVRSLAEGIRNAYGRGRGPLVFNIEAAEFAVESDVAVSCGLIIGELLSNAFKHAFPEGRGGQVALRVKNSEGRVSLSVEDDGVGLPPFFDPEKSGSLGLQIIRALVQQMKGELYFKSGHQGTTAVVSFDLLPAAL